MQISPRRKIDSSVWSYCSTFVLRANSWIWSLLALLSFEPHSYLIMTLTVRVTVKESWNQLEKCNSATFHKDIHHCLSFNISIFSRGERLCKPTITLALRFNIFLWCSPFAMYISSFLNKRAERLRFRTVFGGYCHLPAQNSSRRQVTSVLQGTKTGGLMAPYPANFSIIWSNSPTNLV